jgi:hypothetical protein
MAAKRFRRACNSMRDESPGCRSCFPLKQVVRRLSGSQTAKFCN